MSLPLSTTFDLTDGTYGTIIKLHTNQFTQEDLDFFTAQPEAVLEWAFGTATIPSGLVKGVDDKVYYPIDGYMMELSYSEGAEVVTGGDFNTPTDWTLRGNWIISNGKLIADPVDNNVNAYQEIGSIVDGNKYIIKTKVDTITTENFQVRTGDTYHGQITDSGTDIRIITKDDGVLYFYIYNFLSDAVIDNVSIKEILSDYIPVEGTYTYNTRTSYGIQTMRLELNDAGVPTKVFTNHQIRFRGTGDYVNTGVAIDGSQSDFTMMMGFTLLEYGTGRLQYPVFSQGASSATNGVWLRNEDTQSTNKLEAKIGLYKQTMIFDESNPIHAMVAVYNHSTSQLQVAIDGEPLSVPFDIVFDGPTGIIELGGKEEKSSTCYIGEGILSATMESEDAWFTFWKKVQLGECDKNKPAGEYLSNHTFDCGMLGWDYDPAYPATITDNGDGSLHLKTDSDFGSLHLKTYSDFGSLVPSDQTFDAADWVIEVKFRNQVGNGKISFRRPNQSWVSTPTIGDGVHQSNPFSGAIAEIHVGADGDATYEADYEYISLRKRDSNIVTYLDGTVMNDNNVVTYEG